MANFPKQSAVYWYDPEPTIGAEIRKIRPCIVVSPDAMNEDLRTVLIVPLTTNLRLLPFRMQVSLRGKKSSAACDQLRAIDKSRLRAHIGELENVDKQKLLSLLQTIFA